jgi:hypothetical protein
LKRDFFSSEEWFIDRICVFDKVSAVFKSVFNCYMMLQTGTDKVSVNKEFELSGIFIFILMILYSIQCHVFHVKF